MVPNGQLNVTACTFVSTCYPSSLSEKRAVGFSRSSTELEFRRPEGNEFPLSASEKATEHLHSVS